LLLLWPGRAFFFLDGFQRLDGGENVACLGLLAAGDRGGRWLRRGYLKGSVGL
jgi:hypothetical protein